MRNFLIFVLVISLGAALTVRVRYGGGNDYPDISTPPLIDDSALETVLRYPEPIGGVTISSSGRLFFTVHPESEPRGNKLLEWVAGAAIPYPSGSSQPHLFDSVIGITIDRQNRLWSIDHGRQGFAQPRLLAFDLATGDPVHDYKFRKEIAPPGSFLGNVRVSSDGRHVIISDSSILRTKPALIVYDVAIKSARRILESHESVTAEEFLIRNTIRDLSYFGGLFTYKSGVSGISIDSGNQWLYFAAMNNSGLYRIRMEHVVNADMRQAELRSLVERYSDKPLSDALGVHPNGNIYVTDVEHNAISVVGADRLPKTDIRSSDLRWPSAMSFGPGGYMYVADSALPELLFESKDHIRLRGPYTVFRFNTGRNKQQGR